MKHSHNFIDLTGRTFGALCVLSLAEKRTAEGRVIWICVCTCEHHPKVEVSSRCLIGGHTKSCGHLRDEYRRRIPRFPLRVPRAPRAPRATTPRPLRAPHATRKIIPAIPSNATEYRPSSKSFTKIEAIALMTNMRLHLADGRPHRALVIIDLIMKNRKSSSTNIFASSRRVLQWTDKLGCMWLQLEASDVGDL